MDENRRPRLMKDDYYRNKRNQELNPSTSAQQLKIVRQLVESSTNSNYYLQSQLLNCQKQNTELQHRANSLEADNFQLRTSLASTTTDNDTLRDIAQNIKKENISLTADNKRVQKKSKKRKATIKCLKQQIQRLANPNQ